MDTRGPSVEPPAPSEPSGPREPPAPSAQAPAAPWWHALRLESPRETLAYWAGTFAVVLGITLPRISPLVDYPHHLALAELVRRLLFVPDAPEHSRFALNLYTYNGGFHVLTALLGLVMPMEVAGRVVVGGSLVLMAGAVLALLRSLGRPASHAALFVPALFSFSVVWGFLNFALGLALALLTLAVAARTTLHGVTLRRALATAALGFATACTHVLATLVLVCAGTLLSLELAARSGEAVGALRRLKLVVGRPFVALAPLLPAALFCVSVFRTQYAWAPHLHETPAVQPGSPAMLAKLMGFSSFVTGAYTDRSDQALVGAALGTLLLCLWSPWSPPAETPAAARELPADGAPAPWSLFLFGMGAFLLIPFEFVGTHYVYQRFAVVAMLGLVVAVPSPPEALLGFVRGVRVLFPLVAGALALVHGARFHAATHELAELIDELPPGHDVTGVIYEGKDAGIAFDTLAHAHAYYAARYGGEASYHFARYLSLPVRYLPGRYPGWPLSMWENRPEAFDVRCNYARRFPLVIAKVPARLGSDESRVRALLFRDEASVPELVGRRGVYWAFDTSDVFPSGVP